MGIFYTECVFVALVIGRVKRMRRIMLSSVACPDLPYFCLLFHKGAIFGEKLLNEKCVF